MSWEQENTIIESQPERGFSSHFHGTAEPSREAGSGCLGLYEFQQVGVELVFSGIAKAV